MSPSDTSATVLVDKDGPVTTIMLNRPLVRNAVDNATAEALVAAFAAFDADDEDGVAVFTGSRGAFCAGGDLKEVAATQARGWRDLGFPPDDATPPRGPMGPSRMELSKPVIAAVAGPATAGGTELALWCDIRVMEESAYLGIYCRRWAVRSAESARRRESAWRLATRCSTCTPAAPPRRRRGRWAATWRRT